MRAVVLSFVLLTGCCEEPSFDEQFKKQSAEIETEAKKLERDLKTQIELVPEASETGSTEDGAKN